jgi:hypothetical protein
MRGISANEKELMKHVMMWGSDGYPIRKAGQSRWIWDACYGVGGSPKVFRTKREAVAAFESFCEVLIDATAGAI